MKVLYDHQVFQMQRYGGISRYFYELMSNSGGLYSSELSLLASENEYLKGWESRYNFNVSIDFPGKYRLVNFFNEIFSNYKIAKKSFDIFHPTFYEIYFAEKIQKPFVITIYDLINERYSEYFEKNSEHINRKRELLKKASRVIAISENTKKDIIEYYGIREDKISVTYLAESLSSICSASVENLPNEYLLFVGNRNGYKNFKKFYSAVKSLCLSSEIHIVCAGGPEFSAEEINFFKTDNMTSFIHHVRFNSDNQLKYIYENAKCFIFPSLYEGFGIPLLESLASKCITCASGTSSLIEIGNDGVLYFDPMSEESILSAVEQGIKVRNDADILCKMSQILENYSWRQTCEETFKAYSTALG